MKDLRTASSYPSGLQSVISEISPTSFRSQTVHMASGTRAAVLDSNPRDSLQLCSGTGHGLKMKTTSSERTPFPSNGGRGVPLSNSVGKNSTNWSINNYLLSVYSVPDTVLGTGDLAVNKRCMTLLSKHTHYIGGDRQGRQYTCKRIIILNSFTNK